MPKTIETWLSKSSTYHYDDNVSPIRKQRRQKRVGDLPSGIPAKSLKVSKRDAPRSPDFEQDDDFVFTRKKTKDGSRSKSPESFSLIRENIRKEPLRKSQHREVLSRSQHGLKPHCEDIPPHSPSTVQVELPVSDTPTIRRNQAMRREAGGRRSSLNSRGKRVSSSGSNGVLVAPHKEVSPESFHKHLDPDMSEPQRMRQVLVWCFQRCLENHARKRKETEKTLSSTSDEVTAMNIARVIQDELIQDLMDSTISTSWWDRQANQSNIPAIGLKPNPQNEINKENIRACEARLQELEQEKKDWEAQLQKLREFNGPCEASLEEAWIAYLDGNPQLAAIVSGSDPLKDTLGEIQKKSRILEYKINMLKDAVQKIDALSKAAKLFLEQKFDRIIRLLSHRRVPDPAVAAPSTRDVLRALSRVES